MLQKKKKKSGIECLKNDRNKDWNVFKNTWSYNSFAGANDTKIQNIIGKDVEPHSCWYCTKSISFHWFINFGFWPFLVELILLIFECRFEAFNIFCPLFFPRYFKHEIKNQTRQPNPNFNCLLHSKPPNSLLDCYTTPQISSSLCCPSLSYSSTTNATTLKSHHDHLLPHNPQPLQATCHKPQPHQN